SVTIVCIPFVLLVHMCAYNGYIHYNSSKPVLSV
ncbi:hypothetical protein A2U01_0068664, partial [Trifolium medium]|nr:hypothetical protein [Trifolium medium]